MRPLSVSFFVVANVNMTTFGPRLSVPPTSQATLRDLGRQIASGCGLNYFDTNNVSLQRTPSARACLRLTACLTLRFT